MIRSSQLRLLTFLLLPLLVTLTFCTEENSDPSINGGDTEQEQEVAVTATRFYLGYGEADITPEIGTLLGGYGTPSIHRDCVGINDRLRAQVAIFQNDAGQAFILIGMDSAGYYFDFGDEGPGVKVLRESIVEAIAPKISLEPQHILLGSSHSHTTPDLVGIFQDVNEAIPNEFLEWHVERITQAAVDAANAMDEAELYFGKSELVGYTGRDEGCSEILDDSVTVMQAKNTSDEVVLTLTNYAKHPTQLPWADNLVSADYIWGYREEIEERTGAPAMFLQGFSAAVHDGPLSPDVPGGDEYERAYNMGKLLADAAMEAIETPSKAEEFDIRHRWAVYSSETDGFFDDLVNYAGIPFRYFIDDPEKGLIVKELEVSWHKLGPAEFASFPGESTPEFSLRLKEKMVSPHKFIVGLGNDDVGYIIDHESVENDPVDKLVNYEYKMGLGSFGDPSTWTAMESLGWFDGGWQE